MGYLPLILAVALVTYATRLGGFRLGQRDLPPFIVRFLAYVPVAVFAALIAPDLGLGGPQLLPRLAGLALATVAILRSRQLWAGLIAGMAGFWLAQAALG